MCTCVCARVVVCGQSRTGWWRRLPLAWVLAVLPPAPIAPDPAHSLTHTHLWDARPVTTVCIYFATYAPVRLAWTVLEEAQCIVALHTDSLNACSVIFLVRQRVQQIVPKVLSHTMFKKNMHIVCGIKCVLLVSVIHINTVRENLILHWHYTYIRLMRALFQPTIHLRLYKISHCIVSVFLRVCVQMRLSTVPNPGAGRTKMVTHKSVSVMTCMKDSTWRLLASVLFTVIRVL